MGCGCGKKRNRSVKRLTPEQRVALRKKNVKKSKAAVSQVKKAKKALMKLKKRMSICSQCSHSVQNQIDKRHGLKICHKCNRPLPRIFKEINFKCPIGSF